MSALAKLPGLLWRIDVLAAGNECRSPGCYAEAYRWLSPYCEPDCAPRVGRQGPTPGDDGLDELRQLIAEQFDVSPELLGGRAPLNRSVDSTFDANRYALQLEHRLWHSHAAHAVSPSALLRGINVC